MVQQFFVLALLYSMNAFGQPMNLVPFNLAPQWNDPWRNPPNALSPSQEFFQGVRQNWERYEVPTRSPGGRPYAPPTNAILDSADQG